MSSSIAKFYASLCCILRISQSHFPFPLVAARKALVGWDGKILQCMLYTIWNKTFGNTEYGTMECETEIESGILYTFSNSAAFVENMLLIGRRGFTDSCSKYAASVPVTQLSATVLAYIGGVCIVSRTV